MIDPNERATIDQIKNDKFFKDIDWEDIDSFIPDDLRTSLMKQLSDIKAKKGLNEEKVSRTPFKEYHPPPLIIQTKQESLKARNESPKKDPEGSPTKLQDLDIEDGVSRQKIFEPKSIGILTRQQ